MKTNTATLRSKHMYRSLQLAILCGLIGIIGWLTACSEGDDLIDISTGNGYTISISSTTVTAGVASVLTPTVAKASSMPLSAADDYTLAITARPSGASTDALTINTEGKIVVAASVVSGDAGDYTLVAQGKNAYTGTLEHTFNLTVTNCYAPESFQGKSYTITITAGVYPFASSGQATITFSNPGKDFAIKGDGVNVEDSEGTYSSTISCNTGEVQFLSGTLKDAVFTFTFTSSNSGDYSGKLETSSQSGTFEE